jgi:hypothetical protein
VCEGLCSKLILCSKFLLEKLMVARTAKEFPAFVEPEGALPCPLEHYPQPSEATPHPLTLQEPFYNYSPTYTYIGSRDSSLGILTGYGLDDRGSTIGKNKKSFSS